MITQKIMCGGSLYPFGYLYLDLDNKKTIDQAVSGGYISIVNGSSNSVNFTVNKDCFLVSPIGVSVKISSATPSNYCFQNIPLKANQNLILSANETFNVDYCKSYMNIIPYEIDSKKIYVDYSTGVFPTNSTNFNLAVSAGYASIQDIDGSIYKIEILKDCYLNGDVHHFVGAGIKSYIMTGGFVVKKNTVLNMSTYKSINPLLSSSFVPDIDYSTSYTPKQAVDLGFIKLEDYTYKSSSGVTNTIGKYTLKRDMLLKGYDHYTSEGKLDNEKNSEINFLPLKSNTVFYSKFYTGNLDTFDSPSYPGHENILIYK